MTDVKGLVRAGGAPAGSEDGCTRSPAGHARRARVVHRALIVANVMLAGSLVVLLLVLHAYRYPPGIVVRGGESVSGLLPVVSVLGTGRKPVPEFERPMAVAFGPEGRIYIADTGNHRVVVLGPQGRYLFEFGGFGAIEPPGDIGSTWEEGRFNRPSGLDVDQDGDVYVADSRNGQVQVFDADGAFQRRFPEHSVPIGRDGGNGVGAMTIADVAATDRLVFALDTDRVVVFTTDGRFVRDFGQHGSAPGEFDGPTAIEATDDGILYVVDSGNKRVQALSHSGRVLRVIGASAEEGATQHAPTEVSPYRFGRPVGVAVDPDGRVAVSDVIKRGIMLFTDEGVFVARLGEPGYESGHLQAPAGLDWAGEGLVIADPVGNRVQVVRPAP